MRAPSSDDGPNMADAIRKAEADKQRVALSTKAEKNTVGFLTGILEGYLEGPGSVALDEGTAAWAVSSAALGASVKLFVAYAQNPEKITTRDVIGYLRPALEFYAEQAIAASKQATEAAKTPKN